jgi:hypothetical protein
LLVGLKLLEDPQEGLSDEDLQALAFLDKGDVLCFSLPPAYSKSYSLDDFTATLDIGIMESADIILPAGEREKIL